MKRSKNNNPDYWRSLDQLAGTEQFKEFLYREFPAGTADWANDNSWSRRSFLTTMGASLALAGLAGCRKPVEKIVPYVQRPEGRTPGEPVMYATTMPLGRSAYGMLVKSYDGRPIKVEGNELHPSSLGATSVFMQAATLGLYDPDRSSSVLNKGRQSSFEDFLAFWKTEHEKYTANGGAGLAVLSESFSSPTMERLAKQFKKQFPRAVWASYEPLSDENERAGLRALFGKDLRPLRACDKASVIFALDSDFLRFDDEAVANGGGFARGRRVTSKSDRMNRLYVAESNYSMTGAMADHRMLLRSSDIGKLLAAVAAALAQRGVSIDLPTTHIRSNHKHTEFIKALSGDLINAGGASLVVVGNRQPAEVHALAAAINEALGSHGVTIDYREEDQTYAGSTAELTDLTDRLKNGEVETLVILGGNPVFNGPADLNFASAMKKAAVKIHHSSHLDETSVIADWHLPRAHFLESWSDARSADGTLSVVQPLIEPLLGGIMDVAMLALLESGEAASAHDEVRKSWQPILSGGQFENKWRKLLHDGLHLSEPKKAKMSPSNTALASAVTTIMQTASGDGLELNFYPSHLYDGRFANVGWLMELPDSITKLTWDNAVLMSAATAERLSVANQNSDADMVELDVDGRKLVMPIWVVPGHADDTLSVSLGFGRTSGGRIANKAGFNTYSIRPSSSLFTVAGVRVRRTGQSHQMANTQDHGSMEGRPIAREATLAEYQSGGPFLPEEAKHPPLISLWDEHKYDEGYQWGMSIDLNSCIGCNACTIACQSENNIPVVGKEQTRNGREMHWMRLDRYFAGDVAEPEVSVQPVACQQCEMAPCEQVCPVAATVHDDEGLNVMVYNRCIGTRYCSNNCPYKVRRFNFFNYTEDLPEIVRLAQNPDVTVRFRGVMEKCTYCIQRISHAKITAKNEHREVKEGEIVTACQQACPASAIVFGNINDKESAVSAARKNDRTYQMLVELNIRPRTTYLAKLRNPNPDLV